MRSLPPILVGVRECCNEDAGPEGTWSGACNLNWPKARSSLGMVKGQRAWQRGLTMRAMILAALVAALAGGCASMEAGKVVTGSLGGPKTKVVRETHATQVVDKELEARAAKRKWCLDRFSQDSNGEKPGGAQDLSQKVLDDIACSSVGVGGPWKAENATQGL